MTSTQSIFRAGIMLGLISLSTACVVAGPREGTYDSNQHRYYHENTWHDCGERDEHCH
jgi:hypothetical protein